MAAEVRPLLEMLARNFKASVNFKRLHASVVITSTTVVAG
jgi:hypothetical protein